MEEAIGSALLTPYRALALAVQEAQRNFRTFAHIAALVGPADVRRDAEALARNELVRAATLRGARRRAYHAERPSGMPAPATLPELHALSATWEPVAGAPEQQAGAAFPGGSCGGRALGDEAVLAEAQVRAAEVYIGCSAPLMLRHPTGIGQLQRTRELTKPETSAARASRSTRRSNDAGISAISGWSAVAAHERAKRLSGRG